MDKITNTTREVYNAAHPILVVDATKSSTPSDILGRALISLTDVYLIEYTGIINKDGKVIPVDEIFAWRCPTGAEEKQYTYDLYNVEPLVYLMDKIHVDLDLQSTYTCSFLKYAGAEFQFAPLFAFPEGFTLETLRGNISNMECYTEMMRTYSNNAMAMDSSDHPKTDAPNTTTAKEEN